MTYRFRSRYSEEDTSHLLPGNRLKPFHSGGICSWRWWCCCWQCLGGCCRSAFSTRTRAFLSILVFLGLTGLVQNGSAVWSILDNNSPSMAHYQSYGYCDDPKWRWQSKREHFQSIHLSKIRNDAAKDPSGSTKLSLPDEIQQWYKQNAPQDFHCSKDTEITPHVWVCNPHHIVRTKRRNTCVVYASSSHQASAGLAMVLRKDFAACEVHLFDPFATDSNNNDKANLTETTTTTLRTAASTFSAQQLWVHSFGFASETHNNSRTRSKFRSIGDTMQTLGHTHVDLLVLQCGGCERALDYFGETIKGDASRIGQASIAFHGSPSEASDLLNRFTDHRYVLFHQETVESDTESGSRAVQIQAFSFLKLRKGFFAGI